MSATRSKVGSPEPLQPSEFEGLDQLEELGDEAIIAQQTAAHALQPRANVSEESRSVVITEHAARPDTQRPRNAPKSSAEATVVIRDRRALDEMRQKILRQQRQKAAQGRNALYLWSALGLAAFVLGGIVAFLATDTHPESPSADNQPPAMRGESQIALPPTPLTSSASRKAPQAVRPGDLPVERKP